MNNLNKLMKQIQPLDQQMKEETAFYLDQLTKPTGSLGRLEEIAQQIAGITGERVTDLSPRAVIVMAGDHGICEEGVSAYPQEVTAQMVLNFLQGGAAINALARQAVAQVICVDMGVREAIDHPNLMIKKIKHGTSNISEMPAMTTEEALRAIYTGIELVRDLKEQGYRLLATGEMGIGNTTSSAAILAVLGGVEVQDAVGRGTGIDDERLIHKQRLVQRAIEINQPNPNDPLDVLAKLGGLEIAGLTGVLIGAAYHRLPVVIDGFISSVAALIAYKLAPRTKDYMIASHLSQEKGHQRLLDTLGLKPMLQLDMRLGEGTGAVLCFHLIDASQNIIREMATFSSAGVSTSMKRK